MWILASSKSILPLVIPSILILVYMYMIKYKLFSFGGSVVLDLVETYPKAVAIKLFVSMYVCIYVYI